MKLVLIFVVALFAINAQAIITAPFSNSFDYAGSVVHQDSVFVTVKAPAALAVGTVYVLNTTSDDGITVATSATQTHRPHCVSAEASTAAGQMIKCQVYGYHSAVRLDAGPVAGGVVATVSNQLYISGSNAGYAAPIASPGATNFPIGTILDTTTSSGTVEAFIRLL